jgi:hypothetical protein
MMSSNNQLKRPIIRPAPKLYGLVRPVYKSSSHAKFENYRPITVLTVFDTFFEKFLEHQTLVEMDDSRMTHG